jgi:hypothetical protein
MAMIAFTTIISIKMKTLRFWLMVIVPTDLSTEVRSRCRLAGKRKLGAGTVIEKSICGNNNPVPTTTRC